MPASPCGNPDGDRVAAMPAEAAVTVAFIDPGFFTDADDSTGNSTRTLFAIKRHLERLGRGISSVSVLATCSRRTR